MTIKIQVFKSPTNRKHYFRFRSRNGKIIAQSEGYTRKVDAYKTIKLLQQTLPTTPIEEVDDEPRAPKKARPAPAKATA